MGFPLPAARPLRRPSHTWFAVGGPLLHVKGPVPNGCLAGRAGEAMHVPGRLQGVHDLLRGQQPLGSLAPSSSEPGTEADWLGPPSFPDKCLICTPTAPTFSLQPQGIPGDVHCAVPCLVTQSCLTLCDPMHCSPPGSSVHGLLQERTLEWVAIPFSRGSSQPGDRTWVSCIAGRFLTI